MKVIKLSLIFYLPLLISSCLILPYEPTPEIDTSNKVRLPPDYVRIISDPHEICDKVSEVIVTTEPKIKITDPKSFIKLAFPDGDARIKHLFKDRNYKKVSKKLGIKYLVLVKHLKTTTIYDIGGLILDIGFYGAEIAKSQSKLSAIIIDTELEKPLFEINSIAEGTSGGIGLFYAVFIISDNRSSVINSLGQKIAHTIMKQTSNNQARIVVLQLNPYIDTSSQESHHDIDLKIPALALGDAKTNWRLYAESTDPGPQEWHWLCRAADLGYSLARHRLGTIYYHGLNNVKKDPVLAYVWYKLAEQTGPQVKQLDWVRNSLTTEQLVIAEQLIASWHAGRCERELLERVQ